MFEVSVEADLRGRARAAQLQRQVRKRARPQFSRAGDHQRAELDSIGLLVDFVVVKKLMQTVVDRLDHQFLNEVPPFDVLNPSAENMAKYFYDEVNGGLGQGSPVKMAKVRVWETDTSERDLPAVIGRVFGVKSDHFSGRSSSAKIADTGQTGTQAPQSMHSTGSM
jgi:6-pyruvoyl-tetrahydropterin synthase